MCAADLFLPQHRPQDWQSGCPQRCVGCWCGGANTERRRKCRVCESWTFGRPPEIFFKFSLGLNLHVHSWPQTSIVEQEYCYSSSFYILHYTITSSSRDFELLLKSSLIHSLDIERNTVLMIYNTKPYKIPKNIALQHVKRCQCFFSTPAPLP